eukprot:jgi/Hompol1/1410/HPOL_002346-RA
MKTASAILALFATAATAQQGTQIGQQISDWIALRDLAQAVSLSDCSSQILDTYNEADATLMNLGVSTQFIDMMMTVATVAGDVPEAAAFRTRLANVTVEMQLVLKNNQSQPITPNDNANTNIPQGGGGGGFVDPTKPTQDLPQDGLLSAASAAGGFVAAGVVAAAASFFI